MSSKIDGNASYTDNYLRAVYANKMKENEIKKRYGYTENDMISVYTLPKGQRSKKYGSFSYKPLTARAKRLQQNVYALKGQIRKIESADIPPKEKASKLYNLRSQLKYANSNFTTEVANSPRVGVIVLEEGEGEE